ncbi:unnamed protein product, partial [Linum tenue]
ATFFLQDNPLPVPVVNSKRRNDLPKGGYYIRTFEGKLRSTKLEEDQLKPQNDVIVHYPLHSLIHSDHTLHSTKPWILGSLYSGTVYIWTYQTQGRSGELCN